MKLSRNDPCPCGSGKKYKKCCQEKLEAAASQPVRQPEVTGGQIGGGQTGLDTLMQLVNLQRYQEAEPLARSLTKTFPRDAFVWKIWGVILKHMGRSQEALAPMQKAIALSPNDAEAHNNLGNIFKDVGRLSDAEISLRRALKIEPHNAQAHYNLGIALTGLERPIDAESCFRRASQIKPDFDRAHNNLGVTLMGVGRLADAEPCFRRALQINPNFDEAHNNLGLALQGLGKFDEAVASFGQALQINPYYAEAYYNMGNALQHLERFEEAVANCRHALQIDPDYVSAYHSMGNALEGLKQFEEAMASYRQALEIDPDCADAYHNLGNVLRNLGQHEEAAACYRRVLEIKPDSDLAYSSLLFTLNYFPGASSEQIFTVHREFDEQFGVPLRAKWRPHDNNRENRRLKIGYVSADLRDHAVAYFIEPVLQHHDRERFEFFAYSNNVIRDEVNERLRTHVDHWIDCFGLTNDQLAERIRGDGIDILVDLSNHTAGNRLLAFARKPAPVQVTWIGYPGTTGLTAMDYRITDAYLDPPGTTEHLHSETLIRLPTSAIFKPEAYSPPVNELPALAGAPVTFACLNNPAKITPETIALWCRILAAVPSSQIMLGNIDGEDMRRRFIDAFTAGGIGVERLLFQPRLPMHDYLGLHHQIDLALDSFPYNGGTTTFHSLWMGVPVVSLAGERTISRCGVAVLHQAGLPELVVNTEDEYVKRAVELAGDLPQLSQLRKNLRKRLEESSVADPASLTRALEEAFQNMWHQWQISPR